MFMQFTLTLAAAISMLAQEPNINKGGVNPLVISRDRALGMSCDTGGSPSVEAIGPKQDDARQGIIVQGGKTLEIGPKQDDPRQGIIVQGGKTLEIGPKQDDPRKGVATAGAYNPENDPQAVNAGRCVKKKKD